MVEIIPLDHIVNKIYRLRGMKVMLDRDLAALYEVETKVLKRSVRRQIKRFPHDFMFELSNQEFAVLRRQLGTSNRGGTRYPPMAFTEQGVAMLAGILNSDRAIEVNIQIMRAFVQLRHVITESAELKQALEALRDQTEERFRIVFEVLDRLVSDGDSDQNDGRIGFIE
jgi:phage regulator Rha-like protein